MYIKNLLVNKVPFFSLYQAVTISIIFSFKELFKPQTQTVKAAASKAAAEKKDDDKDNTDDTDVEPENEGRSIAIFSVASVQL